MAWVDICGDQELEDKGMLPMSVEGTPMVLLRSHNSVVAFHDQCSHQDVPLSKFGEIREGQLVCLAHGAKFCTSRGTALCGPARKPLKSYPVKLIQGRVLVDL